MSRGLYRTPSGTTSSTGYRSEDSTTVVPGCCPTKHSPSSLPNDTELTAISRSVLVAMRVCVTGRRSSSSPHGLWSAGMRGRGDSGAVAAGDGSGTGSLLGEGSSGRGAAPPNQRFQNVFQLMREGIPAKAGRNNQVGDQPLRKATTCCCNAGSAPILGQFEFRYPTTGYPDAMCERSPGKSLVRFVTALVRAIALRHVGFTGAPLGVTTWLAPTVPALGADRARVRDAVLEDPANDDGPITPGTPAAGTGDPFQAAVLAAVAGEPGTTTAVRPSLKSLCDLRQTDRERLLWHLAASAAWRVYFEDEHWFATRRWRIAQGRTGPDALRWTWTLHGGYSPYDLDPFNSARVADFQTRTTVGLDGALWGRRETVRQVAPEDASVTLDDDGLVVGCPDLSVDIIAQGSNRTGVVQAAIDQLEAEATAVTMGADTDRTSLPEGSVRRGDPSIELRGVGGIYTVEAWANPGAPGVVEVRAFKIGKKGARLSADAMRVATNERMGWSSDPTELFAARSELTVYEHEADYYGASFELWFMPDDGGEARKLVQRSYRIAGWER